MAAGGRDAERRQQWWRRQLRQRSRHSRNNFDEVLALSTCPTAAASNDGDLPVQGGHRSFTALHACRSALSALAQWATQRR